MYYRNKCGNTVLYLFVDVVGLVGLNWSVCSGQEWHVQCLFILLDKKYSPLISLLIDWSPTLAVEKVWSLYSVIDILPWYISVAGGRGHSLASWQYQIRTYQSHHIVIYYTSRVCQMFLLTSRFFKNIFNNTTDSHHPVVCCKGWNYETSQKMFSNGWDRKYLQGIRANLCFQFSCEVFSIETHFLLNFTPDVAKYF